MKIDNIKEKIGTMIKSKNVDEKDTDKKEKVVKILIIANIIFIIVLLVLLIVKISGKINDGNIASTDLESNSKVAEKKLDDSMSNLYISMLAGSTGITYKLDENTSFSFLPDGTYKGFFDKDNVNISKGKYDVSVDEQSRNHVLNIHYKDSVVSYVISMDNGNILLQYPGASNPFVLSSSNSSIIKWVWNKA